MGAIGEIKNDGSFEANEKVLEYLAQKLTTDEEVLEYGAGLSIRERSVKYIFSQIA